MTFDIRTLTFVSSITALMLFLWLLSISTSRKTYPGFHYWTLSAFLFFGSMELISLRGLIPDSLTVILANTLFISAFAMIDKGLRIFTDSKSTTWFYIITCGIILLSFTYLTFFSPNVSARIVIVSCFVSLYCVRLAIHIYGKLDLVLNEKNWLLILVFAVLGIWDLTRSILTALYEPHIGDYMDAGLIQSITLIIFNSATILIYTSLVNANANRLEADLVKTMEEVQTLTGFLPICANCKNIRDDSGYWKGVEEYLESRTAAVMTHSICPSCAQKLYPELMEGKAGGDHA